MPTTKTRINITLSNSLKAGLFKLARRDKVPHATKAASLLEMAIESEEDQVWDSIASSRDTKSARYLSHKKVWG